VSSPRALSSRPTPSRDDRARSQPSIAKIVAIALVAAILIATNGSSSIVSSANAATPPPRQESSTSAGPNDETAATRDSIEGGWEGYVIPLRRVRIPAVDSGVLIEIDAQPGRSVEPGDQLGRLDRTRQASKAELVRVEWQLAELRARSSAARELDYAEAVLEELDYLDSADRTGLANDEAEARRLRRLLLAPRREPLQRSVLGQRGQEAELEAELKRIELREAETEVARGVLTAPWKGVVSQQFRQPGEWVLAGDPICELVAMDRLKVEVGVPAAEADAAALIGRPCRLRIEIPGGRIEIVETKIERVGELVGANGRVLIEARFDNRYLNGVWSVLPGSRATLSLVAPPPSDDDSGDAANESSDDSSEADR